MACLVLFLKQMAEKEREGETWIVDWGESCVNVCLEWKEWEDERSKK